jgi:serine/threonine protein kinase
MCFELLFGHIPFCESGTVTRYQIPGLSSRISVVEGRLSRETEIPEREDLSTRMVDLVRSMLRRDPAERPQSAADLLRHLASFEPR